MSFDLIVVGGGLAGSTFAARLARAGRRVLVLESEKQFKDRVRGENMVPWGVAAARLVEYVRDGPANRAARHARDDPSR